MARNQRRSKSGKRTRRREGAGDQSSGGSLSSMRSGFRNVVRGGDRRAASDRGTKFLQFLAVLLVLGLVVWAMAR